ncbi:hypothetical protein [Gandjariella thermophila]|uniref:Uncharacterized protein n=1 Tax=Gandjariella thermophila TaxID=1931992 RepID=A0A4D4J3W4_9PSEU|nr:hypothetical protein [Gandjariella thermophila]GDY29448.1 hypothetical protein GTS_10810 [Gandjariella thermophila]
MTAAEGFAVGAQHMFREGNQWGVTVRELISRMRREGLAVCLAWPADEAAGRLAPDDYPTAVLPPVRLPDEPRHALRTPFTPGVPTPE